ncbi:MAG: DUF4388 domain-containing protein [Ktedonobacteraceae bacterium]|nr:DUF4388 domain-containing protein [Ktedonobacteraceae bacterium]
MSNEEMVADSLVRYIQAIQRGRRTGLLIVRRGSGNTREEGRVRFQQGHVSETLLGSRTGTRAFNELCTWGVCLISFISTDGQEVKTSVSPTPPPAPPPIQTDPHPPGSTPLRRRSNTSPELSRDGKEDVSRQEQASSPDTLLQARPVQTRQFNASLQIIENLHLSRTHRQLFLLINGQRSVKELIYVFNRSQGEVLQLLRDLERAAVIRIQPPETSYRSGR